jgi:hypothetical protein
MCLLPSISVQWAMMGWEVGGQRNGERAPNGSTPAVGMGRLRVKRKKERRRTWLGVVVPDDLDVPSVSRGFAVRDVYSIERQVAVPVPRQANAHRHAGLGLVRAGVAHDGRVIRVQRVMMRMRKSNGAVFSCSLATYVFVTPPDIIQKPRPQRKHKKSFVLTTSSPTSPWIAEAPHLVGSLLAQETRARRVATFPRRRRPD